MFAASKSGRAAAAATTDPYFPYVPLLLETTSTNGQQNNTFLDSSTNNFTITRNGTPTQGSVTPYWTNGQWSNYFNGSADYLTITDNAAFQPGSGDCTFEAWVYFLSLPSSGNFKALWSQRASSGDFGGILIAFDSTGLMKYFISNSAANNWQVSNATTGLSVSLNTWQHIAVTRSGNTVLCYKNGVAGTSTTVSTGAIGTSGNLALMAGAADGAQKVDGYMSNFRMVKGVAVYTGAFTSPTTPLASTQSSGTNIAAITGTATGLLTCQSNRFKDNSTNNFSITLTGTPTVQTFQPFSPTASYTAAAYGGSGYFVRASTQYLTVSNAGGQFSFGTGAFTIECWVYLSSMPSGTGYPASYWLFGGGLTASDTGFDFYINNTQIGFNLVVGASPTAIGNHGMVVNNWYHVALVRGGASNQTASIYVNGARVATASSVTATADPVLTGIAISAAEPLGAPNGNFDGYISNYRVVKGTAVYDPTLTTLTVPTSPLTAITNTQLLLNFTNAGIYDAAVQNNSITAGDAQASTTQFKWSPTSIKFDGTGDYLQSPFQPQFQFGSGNFTIEFWVYFNSVASGQRIAGQDNGASNFTWSVYITTSGSLSYYLSSTGSSWNIASGVSMGSVATGTWYYVALVRNGSTFTPYINSVAGTTTTSSAALFASTAPLTIGADAGVGPGSFFNGYIQDFRITKGVARTITTPTAAFPTR